MDFGALPPEINSAAMYAGPGAGPLTQAAAAWATLSAELYSTVAEHTSAITALSATWLGPSSLAMQTAATRYLAWLESTAAQAEATAAQASSAVAAYGTAFAATVPPPVIAANRAQLTMLVVTNLFGQNTPAIAANEALYAAMWAQDAAAMYGYAASSSAATAGLPQFTAPPQTTNPSGSAAQTAAATGSWLDNSTTSGQLIQALLSSGFPIDAAQLFGNLIALPMIALATEDAGSKDAAAILAGPASVAPPIVASPIPSAPVEAPTPVTAASGAANSIGRLSVPPSWAQKPDVGNQGEFLPRVTTPLTVKGQAAIPAVPFMPVTGLRSNQGKVRAEPEYGAVSKVLPPRHPAGG